MARLEIVVRPVVGQQPSQCFRAQRLLGGASCRNSLQQLLGSKPCVARDRDIAVQPAAERLARRVDLDQRSLGWQRRPLAGSTLVEAGAERQHAIGLSDQLATCAMRERADHAAIERVSAEQILCLHRRGQRGAEVIGELYDRIPSSGPMRAAARQDQRSARALQQRGCSVDRGGARRRRSARIADVNTTRNIAHRIRRRRSRQHIRWQHQHHQSLLCRSRRGHQHLRREFCIVQRPMSYARCAQHGDRIKRLRVRPEAVQIRERVAARAQQHQHRRAGLSCVDRAVQAVGGRRAAADANHA